MIYAHIGTHKTASSLIQIVLNVKRERLLKEGITFDPCFNKLGTMLSLCSPLPAKEIERLHSAFVESYKDVDNLLISSEGFCGNPYIAYRNFDAVQADLKAIIGDFTSMAFIRDPVDFIESMYAQRVKEGSGVTMREFLNKLKWPRSHWGFLKDCDYLWQYEKSEGYVNVILNVIKPGLSLDYDNMVINPSLTKEGIRMALANNPFMEDKQRFSFRLFLEENFSKKPGESFNFFDEYERQNITGSGGAGGVL